MTNMKVVDTLKQKDKKKKTKNYKHDNSGV